MCLDRSSLHVFDNGAVLLRSIIWTLFIVPMFYNHNVSRDGEGRAIPRNVVVTKHRDDEWSPNNISQQLRSIFTRGSLARWGPDSCPLSPLDKAVLFVNNISCGFLILQRANNERFNARWYQHATLHILPLSYQVILKIACNTPKRKFLRADWPSSHSKP
jgi:hypothetical protein